MHDEKIGLVSAWIDAFYTSRDDELVALAHDGVEVRPRRGMGLQRCYSGALFVVRDERIANVKMYMSDSEMLRQVGEFAAPPVEIEVRRTGRIGEAG